MMAKELESLKGPPWHRIQCGAPVKVENGKLVRVNSKIDRGNPMGKSMLVIYLRI